MQKRGGEKKSDDSDENTKECYGTVKRKSLSEERTNRVNDLKAKLREKHDSSYLG